ncbi:MAG TPA: DEAD/DEAH box helicase family protein, partial [Flavobacteriales bacterium]|nr:DEAD/DEAH box helicase family protein [Flavobacteriales bacterium]
MGKRGRPRKEEQQDLFDLRERLTTAPCVPAIRREVDEWRKQDWPGITEATRELFNYWFRTDHVVRGARFQYHRAQREAVETLVYLYEVKRIHRRKDLLETYVQHTPDLRLPKYDDFARYCVKMATGSGKTKVMAMAIAWQYANAVRTSSEDYASTFLVLAPNVIVFERLRTDFEGGRMFHTDPLVPRHFKLWWDMQFYMRGDGERAHSSGALYLTNIQQLHEGRTADDTEADDPVSALLGPTPPSSLQEQTDLYERISKRAGKLMVLNDEAHHTHDEESEWNNVIRRMHGVRALSLQLDVTATPRFQSGALFPWTVFDYPLKQAIIDGIVKRPIVGISKIQEAKSEIASVKYKGFLTAGVERWREYRDQLKPVGKKPILFIMMNVTADADDVAEWLKTKYPEDFAGEKTLTIHTDKSGEVSKKDLDAARKASREVDDDRSPVNAIVSVLMLREGWDVQNVTVVVGLRPYTAKANILPEQAIDRDLRLMFRSRMAGYQERVDILGNKKFLEFVQDLEKLEDLKLGTFEVGEDKLQIITVQPDPAKMKHDIGLPEITPVLERKKSLEQEIAALDVMAFKVNPLPMKQADVEEPQTFFYEGRDILTAAIEFEREYKIPSAQTAGEVIGYYARRIAQDIKLPSQFAALAPKVKEFFQHKAFGETMDLDQPKVISAMSSNIACYVVLKEFNKALSALLIDEKEPVLLNAERKLSTTPPFPFSKLSFPARKTVFSVAACDNQFEYDFVKYLEACDDVESFAKLP